MNFYFTENVNLVRYDIDTMEEMETYKTKLTVFAPREHLYKHILENELVLYGQRKTNPWIYQ